MGSFGSSGSTTYDPMLPPSDYHCYTYLPKHSNLRLIHQLYCQRLFIRTYKSERALHIYQVVGVWSKSYLFIQPITITLKDTFVSQRILTYKVIFYSTNLD